MAILRVILRNPCGRNRCATVLRAHLTILSQGKGQRLAGVGRGNLRLPHVGAASILARMRRNHAMESHDSGRQIMRGWPTGSELDLTGRDGVLSKALVSHGGF